MTKRPKSPIILITEKLMCIIRAQVNKYGLIAQLERESSVCNPKGKDTSGLEVRMDKSSQSSKACLSWSIADYNNTAHYYLWGIGEVGIALDWQSRDQEFEPPILHHILSENVEISGMKASQYRCFSYFLIDMDKKKRLSGQDTLDHCSRSYHIDRSS